MYILDCGRNTATIYNSTTDTCDVITHEELLNLPETLSAGSLVICEKAHLAILRTRKSRSQPFDADTLLDLYHRFEQNNVVLKLFPEMSTPRACSYSGLEKNDINDPKSIYLLLSDFPEIQLMNPPKSFEATPLRQEMCEFKEDTNIILNVARVGNSKDNYLVDKCGIWMVNNLELIASNLSPQAKECFNLTDKNRYKKGKTGFKLNNQEGIKKGQIYSVVCTLVDDEGNKRIRPSTGELAGWNFVKQSVFGMSPHHRRGGVARSNLYYHGMMSYINTKGKEEGLDFKRKTLMLGENEETDAKMKQIRRGNFTPEEDIFYRKHRKIYCDSIRELFQVVKKIVSEDNGHLSYPVTQQFLNI
jgi:hypothetical protein